MSSFKIVCSPHLFFFLIRNIFKINSCNQTKPLWSKLQEVLNSEILLPKNTPHSGFFGFPNNKENFEIIFIVYLSIICLKSGIQEKYN